MIKPSRWYNHADIICGMTIVNKCQLSASLSRPVRFTCFSQFSIRFKSTSSTQSLTRNLLIHHSSHPEYIPSNKEWSDIAHNHPLTYDPLVMEPMQHPNRISKSDNQKQSHQQSNNSHSVHIHLVGIHPTSHHASIDRIKSLFLVKNQHPDAIVLDISSDDLWITAALGKVLTKYFNYNASSTIKTSTIDDSQLDKDARELENLGVNPNILNQILSAPSFDVKTSSSILSKISFLCNSLRSPRSSKISPSSIDHNSNKIPAKQLLYALHLLSYGAALSFTETLPNRPLLKLLRPSSHTIPESLKPDPNQRRKLSYFGRLVYNFFQRLSGLHRLHPTPLFARLPGHYISDFSFFNLISDFNYDAATLAQTQAKNRLAAYFDPSFNSYYPFALDRMTRGGIEMRCKNIVDQCMDLARALSVSSEGLQMNGVLSEGGFKKVMVVVDKSLVYGIHAEWQKKINVSESEAHKSSHPLQLQSITDSYPDLDCPPTIHEHVDAHSSIHPVRGVKVIGSSSSSITSEAYHHLDFLSPLYFKLSSNPATVMQDENSEVRATHSTRKIHGERKKVIREIQYVD